MGHLKLLASLFCAQKHVGYTEDLLDDARVETLSYSYLRDNRLRVVNEDGTLLSWAAVS